MNGSDLAQMDRQICGGIWTSPHGRDLMDSICYEFGPRPCGSPALRSAIDFVADKLKQLEAHNVQTQRVDLLAWQDGPASVEVSGGSHAHVVDCIQHVHSAPGSVKGHLVDAGYILPEDLDRIADRIQGAILLVRPYEVARPTRLHYWAFLPEARRRGAAGALICGSYAGSGPEVGLAEIEKILPMPVVGISWEDSHALAAALQRQSIEVKIETSGRSYQTDCRNLVADFGPHDSVEEMIVLSAHLDTYSISPGALDNLTGVLTVLEMLRPMAPYQSMFKRTLRVIIFTGEEYGYLGSKAYVNQNASVLDRVRFNFNMDCMFTNTAEGIAVMGSPKWRDRIDALMRQTQCQVEVRNMFSWSSDYLGFLSKGIPAARPADLNNAFPQNRMHTRWDSPDKVPPHWVRLNALTYGPMLNRLLMEPEPLPEVRLTEEQVEALFAREGCRKVLAALKRSN